jgi:hypothetical protein
MLLCGGTETTKYVFTLTINFVTFHKRTILSMLYNINLQALLYTTPLFTDIENDIINDMVCKYLANTGSVKVW